MVGSEKMIKENVRIETVKNLLWDPITYLLFGLILIQSKRFCLRCERDYHLPPDFDSLIEATPSGIVRWVLLYIPNISSTGGFFSPPIYRGLPNAADINLIELMTN